MASVSSIRSFTPKSSSHIESVAYDPLSKRLYVHFKNGASYTHERVPEEAYTNFTTYRSAGEFYHRVARKYRVVEKVQADGKGKQGKRKEESPELRKI